MEYQEGDIVLCTVDRIVGTTVFVKLEDGKEGSIVVSEIAPGRIRNLRDYVVPKKQIVCKILRVSTSGNIELSLRRVSLKEQKEIKEKSGQERSYVSILKSILGENSIKAIEKISSQESLIDFFEEAKQNPSKLENFFNKEDSQKILDILNNQKQKLHILKKEICLTTTNSNGIELIKNILMDLKGVKAVYIAGGKYSLIAEDKNIKTADNKLKDALADIEKKSKKNELEFSAKN